MRLPSHLALTHAPHSAARPPAPRSCSYARTGRNIEGQNVFLSKPSHDYLGVEDLKPVPGDDGVPMM